MKQKITHLRVSPYHEGEDYYICKCKSKNSKIIEGKWTWDKEKVTCKNCLKGMKGSVYMQRRKFKYIDEEE